jgi:hypothetical protein
MLARKDPELAEAYRLFGAGAGAAEQPAAAAV